MKRVFNKIAVLVLRACIFLLANVFLPFMAGCKATKTELKRRIGATLVAFAGWLEYRADRLQRYGIEVLVSALQKKAPNVQQPLEPRPSSYEVFLEREPSRIQRLSCKIEEEATAAAEEASEPATLIDTLTRVGNVHLLDKPERIQEYEAGAHPHWEPAPDASGRIPFPAYSAEPNGEDRMFFVDETSRKLAAGMQGGGRYPEAINEPDHPAAEVVANVAKALDNFITSVRALPTKAMKAHEEEKSKAVAGAAVSTQHGASGIDVENLSEEDFLKQFGGALAAPKKTKKKSKKATTKRSKK